MSTQNPFTLQVRQPFSNSITPVSWVSVPGQNGSFVVGPNHQPLISALAPESEVIYHANGAEHTVPVGEGGGLVHVRDNAVVLFLN